MSKSQPNVLVFFTDQQRWDTCGCYGNSMGLTPNLDAMARRGALFEHAFTCQPVCGPARASLQTGMYAGAAGVWRNGLPLPADRPTLAKSFGAAGCETAYIGKWHLSDRGPRAVPRDCRGGYEYWLGANLVEMSSHPYDGVLYDGEDRPVRMRGYRVDAMTDFAVDFLDRRRDRPFLLFVSYLDPHHQNDMKRFVAPDGYAERYRDGYVPGDLVDLEGTWRRELPDYYGMVAKLDEALGRLLTALEAAGELDNTIVVFTTDHGCHFGTRGPGDKHSPHDASLRIPLVIAGPGFKGPKRIDELVSLVDVPPTLLSACGLVIPGEVQGRNMTPLVAGGADDWPREVFAQISGTHLRRAIRTRRWMYCAVAPGKIGGKVPASDYYEDYELYDLEADPHELSNLVGRSGCEPVLADLRQRLRQRMIEAGEPPARIERAKDRSNTEPS